MPDGLGPSPRAITDFAAEAHVWKKQVTRAWICIGIALAIGLAIAAYRVAQMMEAQ